MLSKMITVCLPTASEFGFLIQYLQSLIRVGANVHMCVEQTVLSATGQCAKLPNMKAVWPTDVTTAVAVANSWPLQMLCCRDIDVCAVL